MENTKFLEKILKDLEMKKKCTEETRKINEALLFKEVEKYAKEAKRKECSKEELAELNFNIKKRSRMLIKWRSIEYSISKAMEEIITAIYIIKN